MTLPGSYVPKGSRVHALDPGRKLLATALLGLAAVSTFDPRLLALLTALLVLLSVMARVPWEAARAVVAMLPFVLLLFLLQLPFTREAARQGGLVTWRFVILISASSLLTLTTAPTALAKGIEGLLRPLRVRPLGISPKSWGFMLSLSMRFLPLVAEEGEKVRKAQWARGLAMRRSPRSWIKGAVSLALPMLRGLFRRADEVAKAVEARGYRPG